MKITSIFNSSKMIKTISVATAIVSLPLNAEITNNIFNNDADVFEQSVNEINVPPSGTQDSSVLKNAPNPSFVLKGEEKTAIIVVDLSKNLLYKYDECGEATDAYLICSGKPSTPTHTGICYISHVETYPYKSAPVGSKRRRSPKDYGPKIICLEKVNTKTGGHVNIGEFIHGNNNKNSIGKYYSHGCIRMDNNVIKKLSQEVKSGQYVRIIR